MVRSDEELKHDTETLVGAKKKMNVLKENAQNRDKMREAGMALQLFRTMIKTKDGKKSALFKTMNGKEEDGGRSGENRLMGFGEYHHWAYGNVLRNQTMRHTSARRVAEVARRRNISKNGPN